MRVRTEMVVGRGGLTPGRFVVTIEDDEADARTVELDIDSSSGKPKCTAVTIRKQSGVSSRDIRIPLERYFDVIARHPVRALRGRQRRRLTDEFLQAVAKAYTDAGGNISGIQPEVDSRFHASASQKFRWVKTARERGHLHESED